MKTIFLLIVMIISSNTILCQIYSDTLLINDTSIVVVSYNNGTKIFNCQLRYVGVKRKTFIKKPLIVDTVSERWLEPTGKIYSGLKITSRAKNATEYVAFKIGKNEYIYSYGLGNTKSSLKREVAKDTKGHHSDDYE